MDTEQETSNPLNLGIETITMHDGSEKGFKRMLIGNSGLQFDIQDWNEETYSMHFKPEGYVGGNSGEKKAIKYAVIFGAAFYEFIGWWLKEENFTTFRRPKYITGITNETMHNFREKLFNAGETKPYITRGKLIDDFMYKLDLEAVVKDPIVMDKLKGFWKKANRNGDMQIKHQ